MKVMCDSLSRIDERKIEFCHLLKLITSSVNSLCAAPVEVSPRSIKYKDVLLWLES